MAVRFETVIDLLEHQEWSPCADLAAKALAEGGWTREQQAYINYALCRSLGNLDRYSVALQPGQFAVFLAEETGDYELLGRALSELAWVQHRIRGMEHLAVETQRRWFQYYERYRQNRNHYLTAQLNLGVYLRASGLFAEALEQFKRTSREARQRGDRRIAQLASSYAAWEALRLERISEAESLIREGETDKTADPWMRALHLVDLAQLALKKGNTAVAAGYALRAVMLSEQAPDMFARGMEILHRVAEKSGDPEAAIVAAIIAKLKAEATARQDMVAQIRASVRNLAFQYPAAVERLMATIDGD